MKNKKELEEEEIETKKCIEENRFAVTGGGNDNNLISGVWHRGSDGWVDERCSQLLCDKRARRFLQRPPAMSLTDKYPKTDKIRLVLDILDKLLHWLKEVRKVPQAERR